MNYNYKNDISLKTAYNFAIKDLRGGVRSLMVFLICLTLGIFAIAAVQTVALSIIDGIYKEGRSLLGGDLEFSKAHRKAGDEALNYIGSLGEMSKVANLRVMVRRADKNGQTLSALKAIDNAYPLIGNFVVKSNGQALDKAGLHQSLSKINNVPGAYVDALLLEQLKLSEGDMIALGDINLMIRGIIEKEPDRISRRVIIGSRIIVNIKTLEETGLAGEGSLVKWRYRLLLEDPAIPEENLKEMISQFQEKFPEMSSGIKHRYNSDPQFKRFVYRIMIFFSLVALSALLIGGVGIANSVKTYLESKINVIAIFKCLGGDNKNVFKIFFIEILLISILGISIGIILGSTIPTFASYYLANILPIPVLITFQTQAVLFSVLSGLLTTFSFAVWPLAQSVNISPSILFRNQMGELKFSTPNWAKIVSISSLVSLCILMIIGFPEKKFVISFIVVAIICFVLFILSGEAIVRFFNKFQQIKHLELRLALSNIKRFRAQTISTTVSLGLSLTLLSTLIMIDGNLTRQFLENFPEDVPSFFFAGIKPNQIDAVKMTIEKNHELNHFEHVPMMRGRITKINGVEVSKLNIPESSRWMIEGDRGLTYSAKPRKTDIISSGKWWDADYDGEPVLSLEEEALEDFGVKLGDSLTVNVLGRPVTAKIVNTRKVNWRTMSINFIMVFSPNVLSKVPHSVLATAKVGTETPKEMTKLTGLISNNFPNVTSIHIKSLLKNINAVFHQFMQSIRMGSGFAIIIGAIVLSGAMAASRRMRIHDAVILKVLGATRNQIILSYIIEFILIGFVVGLFAIIFGSLISFGLLKYFFEIDYFFAFNEAIATILISILVTMIFGFLGIWRVLGKKPAFYLRQN